MLINRRHKFFRDYLQTEFYHVVKADFQAVERIFSVAVILFNNTGAGFGFTACSDNFRPVEIAFADFAECLNDLLNILCTADDLVVLEVDNGQTPFALADIFCSRVVMM